MQVDQAIKVSHVPFPGASRDDLWPRLPFYGDAAITYLNCCHSMTHRSALAVVQ